MNGIVYRIFRICIIIWLVWLLIKFEVVLYKVLISIVINVFMMLIISEI